MYHSDNPGETRFLYWAGAWLRCIPIMHIFPQDVDLTEHLYATPVFLTSTNSVGNLADQPVSSSGIIRIGPLWILEKPLKLSKTCKIPEIHEVFAKICLES
jgi:hypothetical protein